MLLPAFNLYTDTSRVLTRSFDTAYKGRDPNIAFLKMAHLLESEARYDGIIFGSSRTRFGVDADYVGNRLGGRWYKAEYPGASQREHLHNLKLLIEHDRAPAQIVVMLDDFVLFRQLNTQEDYFYRLYPNSTLDWLDFYRFYLFKRPSEVDWQAAFGRSPLQPYRRILAERRGAVLIKAGTRDTNPDVMPFRYWPNVVLSARPFRLGRADKSHRISSVLKELIQLKELSESHQIKMHLVITPRHYKTLYAADIRILTEFRERLAATMPFFDASPLTKSSTDNRNWREASHFAAKLGNAIFDEVVKIETEGSRTSIYVTAESVPRHLESMKTGLQENLIPLLRQDPRMKLHESYLQSGVSQRFPVTNNRTVKIENSNLEPRWARVMKVVLDAPKDAPLKITADVQVAGLQTRSLTIYDFPLQGGSQEVWVALPDPTAGGLIEIAFHTDNAKASVNHIELFGLAELQTN